MGAISPTFYEQLLHTKIPKKQKKDIDDIAWLFALLESSRVKAVHKPVGEIDPRSTDRNQFCDIHVTLY